MSALDQVPISSACTSGTLSGLKEYLVSKPGVQDVSLTEGPPASQAQVILWEKVIGGRLIIGSLLYRGKLFYRSDNIRGVCVYNAWFWLQTNGCDLPQDLKKFYMSTNGLTLTWKYLYSEVVYELGQLKVCSVQDLVPLGGRVQPIAYAQEKGPTPVIQSALSDIINLTSQSDNTWKPSFGDDCKAFPINYCPSCGHTCLVYNTKDSKCANGEFWLLDLSLRWHPLSSTFSDYLRLAVVHLALTQWPYAITDIGPSPHWEKWFQMFVPKRLEIDQALTVGQVDSTIKNHIAVDTSKIMIMKPSKEKKSKVESKNQTSGNKR